jgi:predicted RNA-binding Zn ribbon-like protein
MAFSGYRGICLASQLFATRIGENLTKSSVTRPPAVFVGDHLALDFINSRCRPGGVWTDWLRDGVEFLDWLERAGVIDATIAARFRLDTAGRQALDEVALRARTLREWLREFVKRHAGREVGAKAVAKLERVNELLARGDSYWQIVADRGTSPVDSKRSALRIQRVRRWTTPEQLLQPLAEAIADLVCHEDFRLIRPCEGKDCVLVFLDKTKAHARRWCSMALCGNRAKAAAHRARASRDRH